MGRRVVFRTEVVEAQRFPRKQAKILFMVLERTESWKPGFLTWEKASDIAPALWVSFYDLAPRYSILL